MSIRVMTWVWDNSPAKGSDRLVLLAIADSANDSGRDAWPSIATIAGKANVDTRTAQRSIRALAAEGALLIEENAGRHGVHRYTIVMALPKVEDGPRQVATPGDLPPRQSDGVASGAAGGGISSLNPRQAATRTVLEPSKTHPSTSSPTSFDEFWTIYPRRTGKRGALSEWDRAVKRDSPADIIDGARRYRDDPNRDDEFTKHPSTWLHNDCWHDDPLPARGRSRERQAPMSPTEKAMGWADAGNQVRALISRQADQHQLPGA